MRHSHDTIAAGIFSHPPNSASSVRTQQLYEYLSNSRPTNYSQLLSLIQLRRTHTPFIEAQSAERPRTNNAIQNACAHRTPALEPAAL